MSNLLGFLQLAVGLAALYVPIYLALKKKYEKLREQHLNAKQFNRKSDKIEERVGLLNTIYIIIVLILISLYFSPFKGFLQFFKSSDFSTTHGKAIYVVSSFISFIILTSCIVKYTLYEEIDLLDGTYQYLFYAFIYIYSIIALLKFNQFALNRFIKLYEESLLNMYFSVFATNLFMDIILFMVYMLFYFGYNIFIDFLNEKFTE